MPQVRCQTEAIRYTDVMSGASRIPDGVDGKAAELLKRAYDLKSDDETHALYRDWAGTYEDTMLQGLGYLSPALVSDALANHVQDKSAATIDIGCGTGLAGQALTGHGFTIIDGLDYSAEMLEVAASHGIYRKLIEADLTKSLDLPRASYASAICTGTFTRGHVGPAALRQIFRLLQPGGCFAFSVNAGVWHDMGFEAELAAISRDGVARCISHQPAVNYKTSAEPDSWLNIYERC
jgi:predicted TPR repeat methyltransferase